MSVNHCFQSKKMFVPGMKKEIKVVGNSFQYFPRLIKV